MMELLAPAGNYDCLLAAVSSGADAVYFAGKGFGARSYAGNFSDEEIFRAADFCHLHSVRTYVTVNTLVFDREYKQLEKFIATITRAGVDGAIVQDLGVLKFIREISPDIELHASTQMTVHSADGVRELERLGVSRVVLARELTGSEIREIIKSTSAEAEVFVHGAMCMSYSGQCLMSSVIGGRSGNRGKCAQPCRLKYSAGGEAKHYLSLKDMCLLEYIRELDDMGVSSLKIEGRMKGEGYVSSVVSAYRKMIDEKRTPTNKEVEALNRVFFRGGLTDGYYTGKTGKGMFAFDKPDNPYLKNDDVKNVIKEKQLPASITAIFAEGEMPILKISCAEGNAEITGDFVIERASNRPATEESIKAQLLKTGGTAFKIENIDVLVQGTPFVPVAKINELRRNAVEALKKEILKQYKNKRIQTAAALDEAEFKHKTGYTCSVTSIEQYRRIKGYGFKRIYIPVHIALEYSDELKADTDRIVLSLPVILRGEQRERYRGYLEGLKEYGFNKAEISTIDAISIADGFEIYASQRLNITNSLSIKRAAEMGIFGICISPELNLAQMRDLKKPIETEVIAYGRIPIMISENCVLKNMDKCNCNGMGEVFDRTGAKLPVMRDGDICRSVILNSVPIYMGDKKEDLNKTGADIRLVFTIETDTECDKICKNYFSGEDIEIKDFTRLYFYRSALE